MYESPTPEGLNIWKLHPDKKCDSFKKPYWNHNRKNYSETFAFLFLNHAVMIGMVVRMISEIKM